MKLGNLCPVAAQCHRHCDPRLFLILPILKPSVTNSSDLPWASDQFGAQERPRARPTSRDMADSLIVRNSLLVLKNLETDGLFSSDPLQSRALS